MTQIYVWSYIQYKKTLILNYVHSFQEIVFVENFYPRKIFVDNAENVILQLLYKEQTFLLNEGVKFMRDKDYDEKLLKMLNDDTRKIIAKTLTKYLEQIHKER